MVERRFGISAVLGTLHVGQEQCILALSVLSETRCSPFGIIRSGSAVRLVVHEVKPRNDGELVGVLLLVLEPQLGNVLHRLRVEVELDGHEDVVTVQDAIRLTKFFDVVRKGENEVVTQAFIRMVGFVVQEYVEEHEQFDTEMFESGNYFKSSEAAMEAVKGLRVEDAVQD